MEERSEIKSLLLEELYADTEPLDQSGGAEKTLPAEPIPVLPAPAAEPAHPEPEMLPGAPVQMEKAAPLPDEAVTRHTTTLWKYRPVPAEEPEPFPECLSRETEIPEGRVIAARVRGKKHKHEGTNCDDWFEIASAGEAAVIAVSDGAGSKKFSRIGARDACRAAAGYLSCALAEALEGELAGDVRLPLADARCQTACGVLAGIVQQAVQKAYEAVEAACYTRAADPVYTAALGRRPAVKDFAGTLLLAALLPVGGERLVISCQVGDGIIALLNTAAPFDTSLRLMGEADSGSFSGETEFLTSESMRTLDALQSRTRIFRGAADCLLVMTDGVADDYFPFEPGLYRLYFDLVANGILPGRGPALSLSGLSQQQVRLFKKLPDSLGYPWINDPSVEIALHYTERICQTAGLSLRELWEDETPLLLSRLELDGRIEAASPAERLKIWLDNYVVRGSFDDRTLVAVHLPAATRECPAVTEE